MVPFSFCLITKNEEKLIGKCLAPLVKTGMEIIVLDTGSTDQTISIAQQYTDKIFHFDWINDFSAARNNAMEHSSNDYVLFIDADEILESIDLQQIDNCIQNYPKAIGRLKRRNLCANGNSTNIMDDYVERLFNRRLFYYQGRIHEQVVSRVGEQLTAYEISLTLFHEGYLGTKEEIEAKANRNNQLLFEELKEHPADPYLYYQLGQSYDLCGDFESAFNVYSKGYALHPDLSLEYVKVMIVSYGYSMISTNRNEEAISLRSCYSTLGTYADYVCMLGDAYLHLGKTLCALYEFKHALTLCDYHVEGSNSTIPAHNLGCIYEAYGNETEAVHYYSLAIANHYEPSKARLSALQHQMNIHANECQKKISLVLSCQCCSKQLSQFLHSLREQTLGMEHLLLICICSTTQPEKQSVLFSFEKEYPDSVLYVQLENEESFESSCQIAMDYISTDYVAFFTGKEYLHPEYCRQLTELLQTNPVDVLCYNISNDLPIYSDLSNDGESALYFPKVASQKEAIHNTEITHSNISTHIFSYSFLRQNNLSFNAEKQQFLNIYQNAINSYLYLNATLLRYEDTNDSII